MISSTSTQNWSFQDDRILGTIARNLHTIRSNSIDVTSPTTNSIEWYGRIFDREKSWFGQSLKVGLKSFLKSSLSQLWSQ